MDKKIDDKKMMCPSGPSLSVGWFEKAINAQGLQSLIVSTTGSIIDFTGARRLQTLMCHELRTVSNR